MSKYQGAFVWHDLMTTDMAAAKAFYSEVIGLTCAPTEMSGPDYEIFRAGERMIAGLMPITDDAKKMGAAPMWTGYICVDDVDAATLKVKDLGGVICRAPADIPHVGRFSVVADPQGAVFYLFKMASPMPDEAPPTDAPGVLGWNELYAADVEAVFPFYAEMFGWTRADAIDMGPAGKYQMFKHGEKVIGGMMNRPAEFPRAMWNFYFNVPDIDKAAASVTAHGGKIINGPMPVPGDGWIFQGLDPQGALFAAVGKQV